MENLAQNKPFVPLPDPLVAAHGKWEGGFCSSRAFALESWAFVLLIASRCFEVILACTGYFGIKAAFYALLEHSGH